jgi:hypothetical protein
MHYKNGREAKNGDMVVMIQGVNSLPIAGILFGATPGINTCNGNIVTPGVALTHYANLLECLHADDIMKATIPDSTKP